MACISAPTALLAGGAISGASSLFGAANASSAATQAAQIQASAANRAADLVQGRFDTTRSDLAPFLTAGQQAVSSLSNYIGASGPDNVLTAPLTAPISTTFSPTIQQLEQTPGYQFVLDQGQKAVTNSLTAQGLGRSGAAEKGAINYAEGLAGTTFQQQFQNWLTQQQLTLSQRQQIYNMYGGLTTLGESAGAQTGSLGIQSAAQAGNLLTSGAAATAGGIVGSANALNSGLSGVGGAASNTALLLALNNAGMFGPAATSGNQ